MLISFILFGSGLFLVVRGAGIFVSSAAAFAKEAGVSQLLIGLSVVAFGTSAPELAINIFSKIDDSMIGLGNAIGASIANIAFILGISAIMTRIHINIRAFRRQVPLAVFSVILLLLVAGDVIPGSHDGVIGRNEGGILLLMFGIFVYHLFSQAITEHKVFEEHKIGALKETTQSIINRSLTPSIKQERSWKYYIAFGILGLGALMLGAHMTIIGGQEIASLFGVRESFIGLVIVSIGTTLPELATAFAAVRQNQPDIIIGNAIGSVVFNILAIIGITAIIEPTAFASSFFFDALVLLGFLIHFFTVGTTGRTITRQEGVGLVLFYILYIVVISAR